MEKRFSCFLKLEILSDRPKANEVMAFFRDTAKWISQAMRSNSDPCQVD